MAAIRLTLPITFGGKDRCSQSGTAGTDAPAMDQKLIKALKRAHTMIRRDDAGLPVMVVSDECEPVSKLTV